MHFNTLKTGDLVAVVAPSGPATPEQVAALPALYAREGLRVRVYPGCHADMGYLAGADSVRLADLHAALRDDEAVAIHCLRGGYGAMRLLDGIDVALLRAKPKLLIGYSDITALHALWWRAGLPSLHAPMPASDLMKTGREDDSAALFALLKNGLRAGDCLTPELLAMQPCQPGTAEGVLIGGNLSLVAALMGTPWAWSAAGGIMFLEDINEEPHRVDRLMTQLRLAGVLDAAQGFVLGSFTEEASPQTLLHGMLAGLGKPVLSGWPTGHGTPNRPLPMGVRVRLNVLPGGPGSRIELLDDFLI